MFTFSRFHLCIYSEQGSVVLELIDGAEASSRFRPILGRIAHREPNLGWGVLLPLSDTQLPEEGAFKLLADHHLGVLLVDGRDQEVGKLILVDDLQGSVR